jgi:outer membrane biosynthesis protein TonB
MERTEKIGLGVATAGHVLLFGLLSAGFLATPNPLKLKTPPMEVSMVDEVALQSTAPKLSAEPPPPSVAPEQGPTEDAAPAPEPEPAPEPVPTPPKPQPKPTPPKEVAKPAPAKPKPVPPKKEVAKVAPKPKPVRDKPAPKAKPAPDKPKATATPSKPAAKASAKPATKAPARASGQGKADKPKGSLLGNDFLKGIDTNADAPRKPPAPAPAAAMGPAQKSALNSEIRRQLKPHWKAPTGADAELLRTELRVELSKDGSVIGTPEVVRQTGITASNKTQAKLHAEQAIKAVRLASPFKLPQQYYDDWRVLEPLGFDRRLSQ